MICHELFGSIISLLLTHILSVDHWIYSEQTNMREILPEYNNASDMVRETVVVGCWLKLKITALDNKLFRTNKHK